MTTEQPTSTLPTSARARRNNALAPTLLLIVAVLLVSANLRPAITGLGPVLDEVRSSLGASSAFASVITALPVLCFGLAGLLAPVLARQHGIRRALGFALALLTAGLVVRVLDGPAVVLAGTFIACAGIAVCNVLIPVVIRESFPAKIGLLTGFYTAALQGAAALSAVVTPVLDTAFGGWRPALGSWAVLAALALIGWLIAARPGRPVEPEPDTDPVAHDLGELAPPATAEPRSLLRSRLAWSVTVFFGLQAMFAYAAMGWIPQVLMSAGVSRGLAGVMTGVLSVLGVPLSLIVTPLASRARSQSAWLAGTTAVGIVGVLGLLLAPSAAPWVWSICLGIGMGVFAIAVALISLRSRSVADTRALSTMAQSFGYLFAVLGPLLFGMLHGLTGGWTVSLLFILAVLVAQAGVGIMAGRPRFV
ncbi:MAG TPA: MFS transporter [Pseudonocardiaceae bacterium]|jgi:CP family cyanate transporter-like MFS transporter|nr:MFS transporter [Pseudonocardiaceae bacterium]